jgi:hypothetical protein
MRNDEAFVTKGRVHTIYTYPSDEHEGFYAAEIFGGPYGDILCLARDPIRAQGFAWRELGERMIKRTQTLAYKATQGENYE